MSDRKRSSVNIMSNLLGKEQYIELQEKSSRFLIASRGIEAKSEEEQQLLKEVAKSHQLDENSWVFFRKEFASNTSIAEVYKSIQQMVKAICEFESEKNVSKILSVRIPADLKAKLSEQKNVSELVRALLEKHLEGKK